MVFDFIGDLVVPFHPNFFICQIDHYLLHHDHREEREPRGVCKKGGEEFFGTRLQIQKISHY
jgi:hypothetical protein